MALTKELGAALKAAIPRAVTGFQVAYGELAVSVKAEAVVDVLTYLRDAPDCLFKSFIDICGVDYPSREKRSSVSVANIGATHSGCGLFRSRALASMGSLFKGLRSATRSPLDHGKYASADEGTLH